MSPTWEAASYSTTQAVQDTLWKPKVLYCVHKGLPLVPTLGKINAVHTNKSYFFPFLISFFPFIFIIL
jgi:hypothetical protein